MRKLSSPVIALLLSACWVSTTKAQVAFIPGISSFPSGATLGVTPVVSNDRRYVRMTLNAQFSDLEGFDTASIPAAVSGGGLGGGTGGNLGGAGGFRSVGLPGPSFVAGMDGVALSEQADHGYSGSYNQDYQRSASAMLSGEAGLLPRARSSAEPGVRPVPKTARKTTRRAKAKLSARR